MSHPCHLGAATEDLFPGRPSPPHTKLCSSPSSCHIPNSCSTSEYGKVQWRWPTFVLLHLLLFPSTEKSVKFINSKLGTENWVTGLKRGNVIYRMNVYCICFTTMPAPGLSKKTRAPILPQTPRDEGSSCRNRKPADGKGKENSIKKLQ